MSEYKGTADILTERILSLIKKNPELLHAESPFVLFSYGLKVDDLQPSLAQAGWAYANAKRIYMLPVKSDGRDGLKTSDGLHD